MTSDEDFRRTPKRTLPVRSTLTRKERGGWGAGSRLQRGGLRKYVTRNFKVEHQPSGFVWQGRYESVEASVLPKAARATMEEGGGRRWNGSNPLPQIQPVVR